MFISNKRNLRMLTSTEIEQLYFYIMCYKETNQTPRECHWIQIFVTFSAELKTKSFHKHNICFPNNSLKKFTMINTDREIYIFKN